MIYSSVLSAVVSALAAECIDNTAKQAWQKLIDVDTAKVGAGGGATNRMQADCWVFARLHSELIPRHWNALVARYSTHKARKIDAIGKLAPLIASPAPVLFVHKAVTAWAIPQLKGAKPAQRIAAHPPLDNVTLSQPWRSSTASLNVARADKLAATRENVRSSCMIVLPAAFYDLNTWDLDANPERTRRRWRKGVSDVLEEMVSEALAEAESILAAEGVLLSHAA